MAPRAASRAGLAPVSKPEPPPLDVRLRPWYLRCKADHDRLATVQTSAQTSYQAKLQYAQISQLITAYRALSGAYAELHAAAVELRQVLRDSDIQLALPLPELAELPEIPHQVTQAKRGSKRAAAD